MLADRSVDPHPISLSLTTIEVVEKDTHLVAASYIGLLDPYHQHVISTFNNWSWGSTHRSLTETDGATTLEVSNFHHTPGSSQLTVLCFPLMAPPGLRLTILNKSLTNKSKTPSSRVASMPPDLYWTLQLCLALANGLQLLTKIVKDNLEG
jgi:hypothetical protein